MDIDQLAQSFKTLKELRHYCDSQMMVISELNKKIVALQEENKHLQDLLSKSTPIISDASGSLEIYKNMTNELAVCLMQIKILKEKSEDGELSLEDTKKLEIYTKLLLNLKTDKPAGNKEVSDLSDEELLEAALKGGDSGK